MRAALAPGAEVGFAWGSGVVESVADDGSVWVDVGDDKPLLMDADDLTVVVRDQCANPGRHGCGQCAACDEWGDRAYHAARDEGRA